SVEGLLHESRIGFFGRNVPASWSRARLARSGAVDPSGTSTAPSEPGVVAPLVTIAAPAAFLTVLVTVQRTWDVAPPPAGMLRSAGPGPAPLKSVTPSSVLHRIVLL